MSFAIHLLDEYNRPALPEPLSIAYNDPARAQIEAMVAHAAYVFRTGKRARVRLQVRA